MQKSLFYCFVLFISFYSSAQQLLPLDQAGYLTTIEQGIQNTKNEKLRLEYYLQLSEFWAATDSQKSKQALDFVVNSPNKKLLNPGKIAYYQGIYALNNEDKNNALQLFETAIKAFESQPIISRERLLAIYQRAYLQTEEKGYDFMVKTLTETLIPLSEKSGHLDLLAYNYTQLGLTFMSVGQFDVAEQYHLKALELLDDIAPKGSVHLINYFNLISNYCYKPDSATAKIYLDKAEELIRDFPDSPHYANYYYQSAMYHTTKLNFKEALVDLDKGIAIAKEKKQLKLTQLLYFRKYNVYLMQKDYQRARAILEQIVQDAILSRDAVNRKITFAQLAAVNEVMGDYKQAHQWMKKTNALGDSLQQQKLLEKMNELEMVLQANEQQATIDRLQQDKVEAELLAKNKGLRISVLGIALILSLIIAFLVYRNFEKQKKLNQQIQLAHQKKMKDLQRKQQFEASQAILQGEEQERERIARDLHDSMGGMLAHIRMEISSKQVMQTAELTSKIDQSIAEMRRISRNLMPETLKNIGFETAMAELCETMSHANCNVHFEAFGLDHSLPYNVQINLYRIAQEALSNILKYAQATEVILQLSQNENTIQLTVEDNGIGFDIHTITYGMGLKNMENRAKLINATMEIHSVIGEGTTINIDCHAN